ncbi:MAG: insulinase family protein [Bacillota bacterium]|nr:insulinase family protein [Bacillota bacterium]
MHSVFKLNNGLRVAVESLQGVNSVAVGLWIKNGSRNEDMTNNGISHFIEHMLFKGTYNRNSKELAEAIEDVGGQLNGFTGKESTCFYIKALKTHLELSLEVLSDMLFNSKFSDEDIEREKKVIGEEINMTEDSPEDLLSDLHCISIWGDDSLSLPILGELNGINSFKREMLLKYVKSHYIPENSVLSICGNVDEKEIEKLAEKYFGQWEEVNREITNYSKPEIRKDHIYKKKKIEQLHFSLGIPGLPIEDPDLYSLIVLNNIFGGGTSSVLFQKLREEMGLCYSIYSYISSYNNTGIFSIYAGLSPKASQKAIFKIKEELRDFISLNISDDRLYKAKEQLKGNYFLGNETPGSKMFSNGKSLLIKNKLLTEDDIMNKIDNITIASLHKVKNNTLKNGIYNSAFVGEKFDFESCKKIISE